MAAAVSFLVTATDMVPAQSDEGAVLKARIAELEAQVAASNGAAVSFHERDESGLYEIAADGAPSFLQTTGPTADLTKPKKLECNCRFVKIQVGAGSGPAR